MAEKSQSPLDMARKWLLEKTTTRLETVATRIVLSALTILVLHSNKDAILNLIDETINTLSQPQASLATAMPEHTPSAKITTAAPTIPATTTPELELEPSRSDNNLFKIQTIVKGSEVAKTFDAFGFDEGPICILADGTTYGIKYSAHSGELPAPVSGCVRYYNGSYYYLETGIPVDPNQEYETQPFSINGDAKKMNLSVGIPGSKEEIDINHFKNTTDGQMNPLMQAWFDYYKKAIRQQDAVIKQYGKTDITSQYGPLLVVVDGLNTPTPTRP